jgi:repressor LexA
MNELAPRQRALLDFVASYQDTRGFPPTIREIGEALGIKSTNGVSDHIKALVKKGYLERAGDPRSSRSIRVAGAARGGFRDEATVAVPLIGRVAAGQPILAQENYDRTFHIDSAMMPATGQTFALTVSGTSMIEEGILDGDVVFVKQQATARNGELVVAMVEGDATVKRFFKEKDRIRLQPANKDMEPIYVTAADGCEILGTVVGIYRRIRG